MSNIRKLRIIKPDRGLRRLVGSQKSQHSDSSGSVRVTGTYIPANHSISGNFFGFLAFTTAIISSMTMIISSFVPSIGPTILFFFLGLVILHTFAIIADGIGSTKIPWVDNSIKVFWLVASVTLIIWATQVFI